MKDDTKEIVSYVFVGGMTTLVNYVVYFILLKIHSHWSVSYTHLDVYKRQSWNMVKSS